MVDFREGQGLPRNWVHHRIPVPSSFVVSPGRHPNSLQLVPSAANLTGNEKVKVADGLTFVGRRQTATLFGFSVDVEFEARMAGEEAGITVFRSQEQHVDLSIIAGESGAAGVVPAARQLRFRATTFGRPDMTAPEEVVVEIPTSWLRGPIRLVVEAGGGERYNFSGESTRGKVEVREMGWAGGGYCYQWHWEVRGNAGRRICH